MFFCWNASASSCAPGPRPILISPITLKRHERVAWDSVWQCLHAFAKTDFILNDSPWKGRKLYDLFKATETPREWFSELFIHAREIGIEIFSSMFSPEDVDFLEQFNPPAYKIASFEITDTNLIKASPPAPPLTSHLPQTRWAARSVRDPWQLAKYALQLVTQDAGI